MLLNKQKTSQFRTNMLMKWSRPGAAGAGGEAADGAVAAAGGFTPRTMARKQVAQKRGRDYHECRLLLRLIAPLITVTITITDSKTITMISIAITTLTSPRTAATPYSHHVASQAELKQMQADKKLLQGELRDCDDQLEQIELEKSRLEEAGTAYS